MVLKVWCCPRSEDLAQTLSCLCDRLYHDAEQCIDRLSYLDQGNNTYGSNTYSLSCGAFPCHEFPVPTGREVYFSFCMNQKKGTCERLF
jgi:hypothetical protein